MTTIISIRRTATMIFSDGQAVTIKISVRKTATMKISDKTASLLFKNQCHGP